LSGRPSPFSISQAGDTEWSGDCKVGWKVSSESNLCSSAQYSAFVHTPSFSSSRRSLRFLSFSWSESLLSIERMFSLPHLSELSSNYNYLTYFCSSRMPSSKDHFFRTSLMESRAACIMFSLSKDGFGPHLEPLTSVPEECEGAAIRDLSSK